MIGIGGLVLLLVLSWIIYRLYKAAIQYLDLIWNREAKIDLLYEAQLDKIGKKHGIDLNKEIIKRQVWKTEHKSFRRRLEEQMYEELFGKESEKEKPAV